jgi:hypothetical protein
MGVPKCPHLRKFLQAYWLVLIPEPCNLSITTPEHTCDESSHVQENCFFSVCFLLCSYMQAWQDADNVLVGTKCNTFLQINIPTRSHKVIPLPPRPAWSSAPDVFTAYSSSGQQAAGIHSVAVSPCGRYVATGGKCVNDTVLFRSDTMTPLQTFQVIYRASAVALISQY